MAFNGRRHLVTCVQACLHNHFIYPMGWLVFRQRIHFMVLPKFYKKLAITSMLEIPHWTQGWTRHILNCKHTGRPRKSSWRCTNSNKLFTVLNKEVMLIVSNHWEKNFLAYKYHIYNPCTLTRVCVTPCKHPSMLRSVPGVIPILSRCVVCGATVPHL